MKEKTMIYITSWARYNDGGCGSWFDVDGKTWDDLEIELKAFGFDIDGYDEELVIHDYSDGLGIGLVALFGEEHPERFMETWEIIEGLSEPELNIVRALIEAESGQTARNAIEYNNLDDWTLYDDDGLDEMIMECLEVPERLIPYIGMEYARREFTYDISETAYGWLEKY